MILSREQMADHRDEVNWAPLSLVITAGTPNLEIHPWNMEEAHSAAEIPVRGIASGHLVDLSMHVKRYVNHQMRVWDQLGLHVHVQIF